MKTPIKIEIVDGKDFVPIADAKRILGAKSAADLRALGSSTIKIGSKKALWSLGWVIDQAKRLQNSDKYSPDMAWVNDYESKLSHAKAAKQKRVSLPTTGEPSISAKDFSHYLDDLCRLLPPPKDAPCNNVDWHAVEHVVGVAYPLSFKAFIAVYGALQWFDWLQPLVPFEKMTPATFGDHLNTIYRDYLAGDIRDTDGQAVAVPKFGSEGTWLPFMTGSDGEVYAWRSVGRSEQWNVICVVNRHATILPPLSLPEMISGWLQGEPTMDQLWGNVDEFRKHSPERLKMLR